MGRSKSVRNPGTLEFRTSDPWPTVFVEILLLCAILLTSSYFCLWSAVSPSRLHYSTQPEVPSSPIPPLLSRSPMPPKGRRWLLQGRKLGPKPYVTAHPYLSWLVEDRRVTFILLTSASLRPFNYSWTTGRDRKLGHVKRSAWGATSAEHTVIIHSPVVAK